MDGWTKILIDRQVHYEAKKENKILIVEFWGGGEYIGIHSTILSIFWFLIFKIC